MPMNASLCASREAFLDFSRIEKALASNSLDAYKRDLPRLETFAPTPSSGQLPGSEELLAPLDSLSRQRLGARSIPRHLSTIRNLYAFLLREGRIEEDPTAVLPSPKQPRRIPRYLNTEQVERLAASPDTRRP